MTENILSLITGEAGALVILALGTFAFIKGWLFSSRQIDLLEKEHDEQSATLAAILKAVEGLAESNRQTLEMSKTLLDIIEKLRAEAEDR